MSINRAVITGNLTRDPELRRTQAGLAILTFGVAVNERHRNSQTGEWEDRANFIDCTAFGNRAESLSKILYKGMKVAVEGRLRWSSWESDGQKRSKIEIILDEIVFMSARKDDGDKSAPEPVPDYVPEIGEPVPLETVYADASVYDNDIPF